MVHVPCNQLTGRVRHHKGRIEQFKWRGGVFFAKIKSISCTFLNNVLSLPALCWLYMEKEEEEDLRNIWKSDVLMSRLKQHHAQRTAQGSEKRDVAKALMKNKNHSRNQILFIFPA